MIYFNGRYSDEFGVYVESYPKRTLPSRKFEKVSIPGRNGDIIFAEDAYENVSQEYEIYISAKKEKLPNAARAVAEWLCAPGYRRLEDDYDPEIFRLAAFQNGAEIENYLSEYGRATLSFDCCPQRYLKSGENEISLTSGQTLINPTGFDALPLITVTCSNGGTLSAGGKTITIAGYTGTVIIDSEEMESYFGETSLNQYLSGTFPKLGKETQISWSGGISAVKIKPRWFEI